MPATDLESAPAAAPARVLQLGLALAPELELVSFPELEPAPASTPELQPISTPTLAKARGYL